MQYQWSMVYPNGTDVDGRLGEKNKTNSIENTWTFVYNSIKLETVKIASVLRIYTTMDIGCRELAIFV